MPCQAVVLRSGAQSVLGWVACRASLLDIAVYTTNENVAVLPAKGLQPHMLSHSSS
jgi:hypothetical protein